MNKCIFLGRLTRNPEIRYTTGAKPIPVANYTLAVDRRFKREGEPTADFLNFVAYAKAADRFLKKGTKIVVTSRVQTRNYTNKDGQKVYVTEFVVEDQEFAESKGSVKYEPEQTPEGDGFMQIPDGLDEELPFN